MSAFGAIVFWGNDSAARALRIPPKKDIAFDSTFQPVQATCLFLLPKSVQCDKGIFKLPAPFTKTFEHHENNVVTIVGARRGAKERIIFVCLPKAVKFPHDGKTEHGPLAMALEIDANNKIASYVKDVKIPSEEKCCGLDLKNIPFKAFCEERINNFIKEGIAKW